MKSIAQNIRYCPHLLETKYRAVLLFRKWKDANFVCRRYHISRASLYRWNKKFDGTKQSLENKSHRPLTPHPNAHTEQEIKWIKDYHRRNPNISICELSGMTVSAWCELHGIKVKTYYCCYIQRWF